MWQGGDQAENAASANSLSEVNQELVSRIRLILMFVHALKGDDLPEILISLQTLFLKTEMKQFSMYLPLFELSGNLFSSRPSVEEQQKIS